MIAWRYQNDGAGFFTAVASFKEFFWSSKCLGEKLKTLKAIPPARDDHAVTRHYQFSLLSAVNWINIIALVK